MKRCLLVLAFVLFSTSICLAAQVDPALVGEMEQNKGLISVIVEMNPGTKHIDVAEVGGKKGYTYQIINGFSADLPAPALKALAKNPNVRAITLDREVQIDLNVAIPTVRSNSLWSEGYTGAGITIAIIDTGIYPHQDFGNRIIAFKDLIGTRTTPYDDNGHGTHCAGIAAGAGSTYRGAAYEAYLVGVKALDRRGSGTWSGVIAAIDWVVAYKSTYSIDILSLSLSGMSTQSSTTDPVCVAVRNAWNAGIVVCAAAGNSGPSLQTIGSPGVEPLIITVGASDDRGTTSRSDDIVSPTSSRGPTTDGFVKPDCVAPGVNIAACDNATTGYVNMSGTSMSTPLVAGICAQFLEAYLSASPNTVKTKLKASCTPLAGFGPEDQGAGLVDAYAFVH